LDAPRFKRKFPAAVLTRSFDYGAEMHILMKDIDLAIAQGEVLGVPMWVCEAARLVFKHAMHKGAAKEDLTAIVKIRRTRRRLRDTEDAVRVALPFIRRESYGPT